MESIKKHWAWVLLFAAFLLFVLGFNLYNTPDGQAPALPTPTPTVAPTATIEPKPTWTAMPEMSIDTSQSYKAIITTNNYGAIELELDAIKAPQTVNNFIFLAREGFYNGLTFHRVINDFMIQGGDPLGTGSGGPGYMIPSEADNGLTHDLGALATAKPAESEEMSGSQFYIVTNEEGSHHLDGEYTVFGKVTNGLENAQAIQAVDTDTNDKPLEPVIIEKIVIAS